MAAAGLKEVNDLYQAGFSQDEVEKWKADRATELSQAGFSVKEVNDYFGVKEPDMAPMKKHFEANLRKHAEAKAQKSVNPNPELAPEPEPEAADGILEALEAGWEMSVTGLVTRGEAPDTILPEDAPMAARIASQISTLAGDVPAMIAGAFGGGALGTAVAPGAGSLIGAGAGSFALPAAIRETLMQYYEKGEIQDFGDFWERSSAVFWETLKGGVVGGATAGVGGFASKMVGAAAKPVIRGTTQAVSEIATMVTVGKALEGEVPKATDFLEAAILVGGLHGSVKVGGKLRSIYARTGMKPEEVAQAAQADPVLRQEILADNIEVPKALESRVESRPTEVQSNQKIETQVNSELTNISNVLRDGESPRGVEVPLMEVKPSEVIEPKVSEAQRAIQDRIVPSQGKKTNVNWDEFYRNAIDDLHPIKQLTKVLSGEKPLLAKDDPYLLARLNRGNYGRADQFLELSPYKFHSLENVGKPLKKIMEPVKDDLQGWNAYAVASRAMELEAKGVKTGVPLEEAAAVVKAGRKKYEKPFREMVEYQNHLLTYLRDSGILSPDAFKLMTEANKSYVPFFRLLEQGGVKAAGSGLKVKNPIKGIKGSEKPIIDPLESIVKNTYLYITLAERNRVLTKMVELSEKSELGSQFMERVKTKTKGIEVKAEEVNRFFEEHGIEEIPEAFTIFRPERSQLAPDEIAVFREGKRQVYKVAPEIVTAVKSMDRESVGLFTRLLSIPAKTLRAGAVLTPDFMMRNLVRDQNSAFILSKHGFIPVLDSLRGLGSFLKKDQHYQDWLKGGGANSALVAMDRQYISQHIFKLSKETGLIDKTWNVVKSPLELARVAGELIENSTRLGEFKRATKGDKSASGIFSGALDSREVTLDFSRIGAKTRAMNMITAFWNAHVQGLDRTARAFKENPIGTSAKVAASITMPSVLLWFANHDDPRWKEIPRWQKDLFWIVMTKDHIYRIPKPFELGLIFGSLPERALEAYFTENSKAFDDFADSMKQAFTPSYIPTFAVPVIEHFANRSLFTGGPIIPSRLEGILPEYQYSDYTTESGKLIGKVIATLPGQKDMPGEKGGFASPAVIENYIRAWSGNMGMYALKLADKALIASGAVPDPVKPTDTLADLPFVKAFVIRHPSAGSQSIQDFYDSYFKNKTHFDTIRQLARGGDFENMDKELKLSLEQGSMLKLDGIKDALGAQSRFARMIYKNKEMTPDEKRQAIDSVYFQMIEIAKTGNQIMDELGAVLNTQ